MPPGFSWIEPSRLAAMAYPDSPADLFWLRQHGIEVLISLTEDPAPRHWVNEAGLMLVHVPVPDMSAPSLRQFDLVVETIERANKSGMGVAIHCAAGRGRTGTIIAAYLTTQGMSPTEAIQKVRDLRPGSIETLDQEQAIEAYATRKKPQ